MPEKYFSKIKIKKKNFFQIYNLKVYLDSVCQEIGKLILCCRKHYYMYRYALPTNNMKDFA